MNPDLGSANFPDVERAERLRTLIVPVGSTEQHGPHLPLSTDTVIASAWAAALCRSLEADGLGPVSAAPALAYGAAGEHQDFGGTLSIGTEVTALVVVELVRSARHFTDAVVVLSGHAGNADALTTAVGQLRREGHDVTAVLPILPGSDAHAGRTETSLMLHLAPAEVRLDLAEPGNTTPIADLLPALRTHGVSGVAPNGVLGDPTGATAEEGRVLLEELVDHARRTMTR